ncbi:MAG: long-chain fatty acid--CoA ligase [Deltaproteobacteria bacterium]|nr:MAG: long-chain fatty acid--CoA ligase [Deltaproteobacteria bacterium]
MTHDASVNWQPNSPSVIASIMATCQRFPERPAFIYRVGSNELTVDYEKFREDVILLTRAFEERKVKRGSRVMLLSDNRYAWIVTDLALMALGAVSVPRGSETPTQELEYILNHAQCTFIVVETEALLTRHQEMLSTHKEVKTVFIIEGTDKHTLFNRIYAYNDILKDRTLSDDDFNRFDQKVAEVTQKDLLTIIFTSGTTGNPKGVMLSHRNFLFNTETLPPVIAITEQDLWVSILPSWHVFERTLELLALTSGSCTVYSSLKTFSADLVTYKPTLVATVPRLWESLYSKVMAAVMERGDRAHKMFNLLVKISIRFRRTQRLSRGHLPQFKRVSLPGRFIRKLIALGEMLVLVLPYRLAQKKLAPLQEKFGGQLRMAVSGGGSLPIYLESWLDAIGIRIANAYGMTECAPAIAGRGYNSEIFGTLGQPVSVTELRVVDSENNQVAPGVEGEVEIRGPQVFDGYCDNDEENRKAFTADGFFRTGDLGKLTIGGELILTGRSKEIIVLASGENIDPSRIEGAINQLPFVNDAVLVGQDRKGLAALIVPDWDKLKDFVTERFGQQEQEVKDLHEDHALRDRVKNEINRLLKAKNGFKPYEKLQKIDFLKHEFTVGEELTNTFKKRRHIIERKYKELIDRLFK